MSEWEEAHLPLPLAVLTALREQEQIVNRQANRRPRRHSEDAGHPQTNGNMRESVVRQSGNVVRDEDAVFTRCPFQNGESSAPESPAS